eukprot:423747_1
MPGIAEELFVHSDKLPIRLYCSICLDVAEAAIITQCDHLFCTECIEQLQTANGNNCECPNCREPILPMKPATNARNFLSQQQVYCSDMDALRCGWIGKYSMWHTHRAKYCDRASTSDKRDAKNAVSTEIGNFHKEELNTMSVGRLRKILQQYIKLNRNQLSDTDIHQTFNWKLFLEKKEYVHAIVEFQSTYGLSGQLMNHNSPSKPHTQDDDNTCTNHTQFPTTYDTLKRLKIRELSSYLRSKNIDPSSAEYACIEKSDLIKLVLETQKHYQEIINGKAYDPKLEKQQFSPPPPSSNDHTEYKEEIKEDPHPTNNQNNNNNNASSTAYHFTSDHLRRSSINRIDINLFYYDAFSNVLFDLIRIIIITVNASHSDASFSPSHNRIIMHTQQLLDVIRMHALLLLHHRHRRFLPCHRCPACRMLRIRLIRCLAQCLGIRITITRTIHNRARVSECDCNMFVSLLII